MFRFLPPSHRQTHSQHETAFLRRILFLNLLVFALDLRVYLAVNGDCCLGRRCTMRWPIHPLVRSREAIETKTTKLATCLFPADDVVIVYTLDIASFQKRSKSEGIQFRHHVYRTNSAHSCPSAFPGRPCAAVWRFVDIQKFFFVSILSHRSSPKSALGRHLHLCPKRNASARTRTSNGQCWQKFVRSSADDLFVHVGRSVQLCGQFVSIGCPNIGHRCRWTASADQSTSTRLQTGGILQLQPWQTVCLTVGHDSSPGTTIFVNRSAHSPSDGQWLWCSSRRLRCRTEHRRPSILWSIVPFDQGPMCGQWPKCRRVGRRRARHQNSSRTSGFAFASVSSVSQTKLSSTSSSSRLTLGWKGCELVIVTFDLDILDLQSIANRHFLPTKLFVNLLTQIESAQLFPCSMSNRQHPSSASSSKFAFE